ELDVLVATTVIEVGVDVPAATVMIVEDADRFGLAQLHQLRGRVGRGGGASHCLLLTSGARTTEAARRLAIMEETCDGFRLAEEDLSIRGPGEILGTRQAGLPKLRFGDLVKHAALAAEARRVAERLLENDPTLARPEHAVTAQVLAARSGSAVTAEGGGSDQSVSGPTRMIRPTMASGGGAGAASSAGFAGAKTTPGSADKIQPRPTLRGSPWASSASSKVAPTPISETVTARWSRAITVTS